MKRRRAPFHPVLVRSTLWQGSPLGDLEAEPRDGKKVMPVRQWDDQDEAWKRVMEVLEALIEKRQAAG